MAADGLTKALPTQKHKEFIKQLNLVDIKHLITWLFQLYLYLYL